MRFGVPRAATYEADLCRNIAQQFQHWEVVPLPESGELITDRHNTLSRYQLAMAEGGVLSWHRGMPEESHGTLFGYCAPKATRRSLEAPGSSAPAVDDCVASPVGAALSSPPVDNHQVLRKTALSAPRDMPLLRRLLALRTSQ